MACVRTRTVLAMANQKLTARVTGALYLAMGLLGMCGFLFLRQKLYVPLDATQTAQNLVSHDALARLLVVLELGVVITQALTAVWFFKLFRQVNAFAAGAIAAFGLINAVAILGSAVCVSTALAHVQAPATALVLFDLSAKAWLFGGVFFGLWLVPMGVAARASGMPAGLGWTLIVGGIGYVLSALLGAGLQGPSAVVDGLVMPASIGEFWMIGYLLIIGWREPRLA